VKRAIIYLTLFAAILFAQGDPHSILGNLEYDTGGIPEAIDLDFHCAYMHPLAGTQTLEYPADNGAGTAYNDAAGMFAINTTFFSPYPGTGDTLYLYFDAMGKVADTSIIVDASVVYQYIDTLILRNPVVIRETDYTNLHSDMNVRVVGQAVYLDYNENLIGQVEVVDVLGRHVGTVRGGCWVAPQSGVYFLVFHNRAIEHLANGSSVKIVLVR
jgi:hypothetical protein